MVLLLGSKEVFLALYSQRWCFRAQFDLGAPSHHKSIAAVLKSKIRPHDAL
jgi:hypothetical protein